MNSSFIITIFLLLTCIILSQATEYYLRYLIEDSNTIIEGRRGRKRKGKKMKVAQPIQSEVKQSDKSEVKVVTLTPDIISRSLSALHTKNTTETFLSTPEIQHIYNNSVSSALVIKPISTIKQMNTYLLLLQEKLNGLDSPPLNQIIYFCVSLPYAFKNFFVPDQSIAVPYNKLLVKMPDIFRNSKYYTQIQMICIQWQQCMLIFNPSPNIGDPRSEVYINVMNQYISQINTNITNLLNYSNPVYIY